MSHPPAKKSLGQNFLVDANAVERIVDALSLDATDTVVEIGPGRGALTERLLTVLPRLVAVELDARLAVGLRQRFGERLCLHEIDVLKLDFAELVRETGAKPGGLVVVGNLPYNISKPLALRLIENREHISRAVLMFQREVAARLTAGPGDSDYAALSVLSGSLFSIRPLFHLKPDAFRPRPKIVSTVTHWEPLPGKIPSIVSDGRLRRCLAACFARRRQRLRNNLRAALGSAELADRLLREVDLDGSLRAQQLPPESFHRLAAAWPLV